MKKKLTKGEALEVADRLDLTRYADIDCLIDSLHIEHNKEISVCVVTTDKRSAEQLLSTLAGLDLRLGFDTTFKAEMRHGEREYTLSGRYGELCVDEEQFRSAVAHGDTDSVVVVENDLLKNLRLTLVYAPEYSSVDTDTWRCMLLGADRAVLVVNANRILGQREQRFVSELMTPIFSPSRLLVGIGNAQYVPVGEWEESVERVRRIMGREHAVFPIFTDEVPEELRAAYSGSEVTPAAILEQTCRNAMAFREQHVEDLDRYRSTVLEEELTRKRQTVESLRRHADEAVKSLESDIALLGRSRSHIENYIDLFLKTPLVARYREEAERFAQLLTKSLTEDIERSADIKRDAKALPRYLTYVWDQFTDDCNSSLSKVFEHETSTIVDMMGLDLKRVARDIGRIDLDSNLGRHLEGAFSVHTFFARKTTAGNGLTDALTIGGVISTIFCAPVGIAAILSSELIKVFGKKKFDREYKEELSCKIAGIVDGNKNELLAQASANFGRVAGAYRKEIMGYYDDTTERVRTILAEEMSRLAKVSETVDYIDTLI